jgi:signal transduction histidine kinase
VPTIRASQHDLPRRQLLLLSLAVLLPSVLLVSLGTRTVFQERELAEKRLADRHRDLADDLGRGLLIELRRVALDEAVALADHPADVAHDSFAVAATALVARVDSAHIVLPWNDDERTARFARLAAASPFATDIARGQRLEFVARRFDQAAVAYRSAIAGTSDAALKAYGELLVARTLAAAGSPEAWPRFVRLLQAPIALRDELGVPVALYAAHRLADRAATHPAVAAFVRRHEGALLAARTLSPVACSLLAELPGADVVRVRQRCAELDVGDSLSRDPLALASLGIGEPGRAHGERWTSYDGGRWLVGLTSARAGAARLVVAVRRDSALAAIGAARDDAAFHLVAVSELGAVPLGHGIDGLALQWPLSAGRGSVDPLRAFWATAFVLLLGVAILGTYTLWRDVRRDLVVTQMRSQFVASVSHELKTPLTSIRMFAETLRDRPDIAELQRSEYLATIITESERLTRLLQNVLDFSRLERGVLAYRMTAHDLGDIVRSAVRTLQYPLAQQGYALDLMCDSMLPPVICDADAVEQAVLNLLTNAMKYSGESRRLAVTVGRHAAMATVAVRDFGVGIAPEHQAHVFEKFYRAPTPENETVPGTGLGLALVEHVATAHGGRVIVESETGAGSTFELQLALGAPAQGIAARAIAPLPADAVSL